MSTEKVQKMPKFIRIYPKALFFPHASYTKVQFCTSDEDKVTVSAEPFVATVVSSEVHTHEWKYDYSYDSATKLCKTVASCVCGESDTITHTRGNIKPNMTLASSLGLQYTIRDASLTNGTFSDVHAVFTKEAINDDGATLRVDMTPGEYSATDWIPFEFDGILASQMMNKVAMRCFGTNEKGQVVMLSDFSFSVGEYISYCLGLSANQSNKKMLTLLADLANYGTISQQYFSYNLDNLPNNYGNTPKYASYVTDPQPTDFNKIQAKSGDYDLRWKATVDLGNVIATTVKYRFAKSADETNFKADMYAVIKYTDSTGAEQSIRFDNDAISSEVNGGYTWYSVHFDKLFSYMLNDKFTVEVYSGETKLCACDLNMEACLSMNNNTSTAAVISATLAYGRSAYNFFNN